MPSPHSAQFDAHALTRIQVFGTELETALDRLEHQRDRYVADGVKRKAAAGGAK